MIAKIARGLAAVHQRGILHLDLKPNNIIVDENGEPRVLDFGLACLKDAWCDDEIEEGVLRGTLPFMAPEQAKGESQKVDQRTDVFGLGCVLFYLLARHSPYSKGSFTELLNQAQNGEWERESLDEKIPEQIRDALQKAMAFQPESRFENMTDFAECLERSVRVRAAIPWFSLVAILLVGVGFGIALLTQTWLHSSAKRQVEISTLLPLHETPKTTIEVWDSNRYLSIANAAPLYTGDEFRIRTDVPAGMYASLFAITYDNKLRELNQVDASDVSQTMRFPIESDTSAPLIGPPCTEIILVCASRTGPVSKEQVAKCWGLSSPLPLLPELTVLRFDSSGIHVEQQSRDFAESVQRVDPEEQVHRQLEDFRQRLLHQVEFFDGIAFSHQP
jgi:serine/threonine protein kinase